MNDLQSIAIPKPFWDELENALMIKSKELVKDIAKVLRVDERKLLTELRSQKKAFHLLELDRDEEEKYECSALVQTNAVAFMCRKPIVYGKRTCPEHEFFQMTHELVSKPNLQRILLPSKEEGTFFADALTQQIYSINYERMGYIQKNKCFLFEVEAE